MLPFYQASDQCCLVALLQQQTLSCAAPAMSLPEEPERHASTRVQESKALESVQERRLGDEERADLERQVSELRTQVDAGNAGAEVLQRAASGYAALGRSQEAAGVLEKLVEKEPASSSAWGMLVRPNTEQSPYLRASWTPVLACC